VQRVYSFTIIGKSGPTNIITHTVNVSLTVGTSDFNVVLDSPGISYPPAGGPGTRTVTINPIAGFAKSVTLSASGLPTGASAGFIPQSITPAGSSQATITLPPGMAPGSYSATIVGTVLDQAAGNPTRSTPITLVVQPAGSLP